MTHSFLKADADLSAASHQAKSVASKSKGLRTDFINAGSIKLVMAGSGCENAEKVEQVVYAIQNWFYNGFSLCQTVVFLSLTAFCRFYFKWLVMWMRL